MSSERIPLGASAVFRRTKRRIDDLEAALSAADERLARYRDWLRNAPHKPDCSFVLWRDVSDCDCGLWELRRA